MQSALAVALLTVLGGEVAVAAPGDRLEIWSPLPAAPRAIPAGPQELHVVRRRGERLAPVGDVEVHASGGAVFPLSSSDPYIVRALFLPEPNQRGPVLLTATSSEGGEQAASAGQLALALDDRAMPRVEVRVDPPVLTKGKDEDHAVVEVRTVDANGRAFGHTPPRLFTNTGTVTTPREVTPGVFEARYTTSGAPFPEVAVLVALLPYPHEGSAAAAMGQAVLKQPAAIELPGETRPGVEMTVEIAGERFGPVRADDRGRFRVPVVVPPGIGAGAGLSRDRLGTVKRTRVNLQLPPTRRLALAAHPRVLVADGSSRALVVLTALTQKGDPLVGVTPRARAKRGELGPLVEVAPGVFQAWYRAPVGVEAGEDPIEAELPGDKLSRTKLPMTLVSGPPVSLTVEVADEVIEAPSDISTKVGLVMADAYGSSVRDAEVRGSARHGTVVVEDSVGLVYRSPGSATPGADRVSVHAFARARGDAVRLAFSPPSTLIAVDGLGRPAPGAAVRAEGRLVYADGEGRVLLPASSGIIEVQLPGSVLPTILHVGLGTDGQLHGAPRGPPTPATVTDITLAPPHEVDVTAEVSARDAGRLQVRYVVKGATSGDVRIYVDGVLASQGRALEGEAWVAAPDGAWVTVTHVPSGIATAFRAGDAT